MTRSKILFRPHLFQPADRAVELEPAITALVEQVRFRIGGGEQLDLLLVQRVDQRDEPRGLVAIVRPELWNTDKDDRMIARAIAI